MGDPASPSSPQRLFLAVRPPPKVIGELAGLPRQDDSSVRWVKPENWHITLRFVGEAVAEDVVAAVDATMPVRSVSVALGPRVTMLGSAVVVPAGGLDPIATTLHSATRHLGDGEGRQPFRGHLTVGRLRRGARTCALVGHEIDLAFPVEAVELISSRRTDAGSVYRTLASWAATSSGR